MKNVNIFMVGIILSLVNPGILSSQSTLTPTSSFLGTHEYERVGYHLHTAGDVNGDGYDDFLVGTFHNDTKGYDAGAAYLFLGSKSADWGHDISLLNSDARFLGAKHYESAGYFLGGGGDVNGDGLDDMLIGAADGYLYIVFGRTAADWGMDFVLYDDADAWYEEEGDEDQAGISNAIIGDMNGDGYDDIICGAPFNDYGGGDAGKAYIILGKATGWHQGVKLNKSDASFYRSYGGGTFGYCVDGVGDVNGDDLVNSTDALIVLSCDVGINVSQFCPMNCGDVNDDGFINSTDALIILSYDVGISVPFPVGETGCASSVTQCSGCNP